MTGPAVPPALDPGGVVQWFTHPYTVHAFLWLLRLHHIPR